MRDRKGEYRERNLKRPRDTRSRAGRCQNRTGRKQNRTGRKQNRNRTGRIQKRTGRIQKRIGRMDLRIRPRQNLRVLNIQRLWARMLLEGEKTVEVRKYSLRGYRGQELWVCETSGPKPRKDFKTRIIGAIRFDDDFEYAGTDMFARDEHRHCIKPDSPFAWDTDKHLKMYGWLVLLRFQS